MNILRVIILWQLLLSSLFLFAQERDTRDLIEILYKKRSGYGIGTQEEEFIKNTGSSPTYGEITYDGAQMLIDEFNLTKNDVFYDLGCGVGKFVVQVYLNTPVKKTVGIELSKTRANNAGQVNKQLKSDGLIKKNRKLVFAEKNILDADLSDATAIFISSLCFSDELMKQVTDKLVQLKPGLRVATSRELAENPAFELVKVLQIPMSWSQSSQVHFYKLKK